VMMI